MPMKKVSKPASKQAGKAGAAIKSQAHTHTQVEKKTEAERRPNVQVRQSKKPTVIYEQVGKLVKQCCMWQ